MANIQWEELLHFLAGYLREHHPNVYNVLSRDAWEAELDRLMREMPAMHANQAKTAIAVFLAAIGDAHTGLRWEPEVVYPIGLYWFSEGLYVIHAQDEYNHLLDSRVLAINGCGVDQLVESVKQVIPHENKQRLRQELPNYLIHPGILHGLGITPTEHAMQLTCMAGDGTVKTAAVTAVPNFRRDWLHYSGLLPQGEDGHTPLYLKNRQLDYWFEYVSEHQTVYFQYNCCCDNASYPLADLIDRLLQCINSQGAARLTFATIPEAILGCWVR